ncbi:hypothetical protein JDV02_003287 [Purpureocillium takamizusanense]|nr:uncharacterized protein JDV02_003287 [Purpureocillium takamizusanense]UNI16898.1 hypothetical protein JDV02_003287 [Purpureocillium takamizusanense]
MSNTGVHYGTGQHMDVLEPFQREKAMMYWWYCYMFYILSMVCSKLSFAWFLLRITTARAHAWVVYAASLLSVIAATIFFFVTIFQCKPVSFYWTRLGGDTDGSCLSMDVIMSIAYFYSICSIVTDFTFAVLPAFVIWNLQLKLRARLALIFLIAMGCVASSALVVRCAFLKHFRDVDFLYSTIDIVIWSSIEMGLAISAASLATLRPLVKAIALKLGITSARSSPPYYGTGPRSKTTMGAGSRNGTVANPFDPNVYVMSEFSQGTSGGSPRNGSGHFGTETTAYAGSFGKSSRQYAQDVKLESDNESQEQLHEGSSERTSGDEGRRRAVPKSFLHARAGKGA